MSQPKASQFCSGGCRAVLVRYCAQTFIYCFFGRDSRSELALVFQPGRWTGVFMPLSILYLRRHIFGCCSDLTSCYIFVSIPSMIFTYICLGIVLFYLIYFGVWDLFSFFQLLSPQARLNGSPSMLLTAVSITCEPLIITGVPPHPQDVFCVHEGTKSQSMQNVWMKQSPKSLSMTKVPSVPL